MKVTGHQIIQRIGEVKAERSLHNDRFTGTLFQFPSDLAADDALKPGLVIISIEVLEEHIAFLQHALATYGSKVKIIFEGRDLDLRLAVKLLGGMDRAEKLWRQAAKVTDGERGKRRSLYDEYDRKKADDDVERLERVVPIEEAMKKAQAYKRRCSALRGAIAGANATGVECLSIGLDPKLLALE